MNAGPVRPVRPPIVDGDTWLSVVEHAGYRCQCRGECGSTHSRGAGRCLTECPAGDINAVPANPATTELQACALPPTELVARCLRCHDNSVRRARPGRHVDVDGQLNLLEELEELDGLAVVDSAGINHGEVDAGAMVIAGDVVIAGKGAGKSPGWAGWSG